MSEITLMQAFMYRCGAEFDDVRILRRNVGAFRTESGGFFRAGLKGQADCVAYIRGGKVVEIETKAKVGRLSKEQEHWRDWCHSWGVPWMQLKQGKNETEAETVDRWVLEFQLVLKTVKSPSSTSPASENGPRASFSF